MGLLDSVIGGLGGGQSASGGMSPLTKALLMLLAAKAASSHFGRSDPAPAPSGPAPGGSSDTVQSGILAGVPSLEGLLNKFRSAGHQDKLDSWVGSGANKSIAPHELGDALGSDTVGHLQRETGMSRGDLLGQLSSSLPGIIDKLTPHGRMPSPEERSRW